MALVSPNSEEYEFLVETIKTRVEDSQGETIYEIGVGGIPCSYISFTYIKLYF